MPVCGALSHGDHGICAYKKFFIVIILIIMVIIVVVVVVVIILILILIIIISSSSSSSIVITVGQLLEVLWSKSMMEIKLIHFVKGTGNEYSCSTL